MHPRNESTMEGWGTDRPIGQGVPMTRHTGAKSYPVKSVLKHAESLRAIAGLYVGECTES